MLTLPVTSTCYYKFNGPIKFSIVNFCFRQKKGMWQKLYQLTVKMKSFAFSFSSSRAENVEGRDHFNL